MTRATSAVASRRRRKRILKQAKGFWGDRKNHIRLASEAVVRAMSENYRHRKQKKRDFRSLWITRLSVATKLVGVSYSVFMNQLKESGCQLNRKMLSEMAIHDPQGFHLLAEQVQAKSASS